MLACPHAAVAWGRGCRACCSAARAALGPRNRNNEPRPRRLARCREGSGSKTVIAATQLKVGMIIMHNAKPHRVTNVLHVTPGNWRGMVQTRLVNIETGSNTEHRFRSEDKVDKANMELHTLQFSYRAGDQYHFMNTESYEMVDLPADVLGDAVNYLTEGMVIQAD